MDKLAAFEQIKIARNTVKLATRSLSDKTQTDYSKVATRLLKLNKSPITHAKTKNSFYKYRAAWIYHWSSVLNGLLTHASEQQSVNLTEWFSTVEYIKAINTFLADYQPDPEHTHRDSGVSSLWTKKAAEINASGKKITSLSKRKTIRKLPNNWRDRVVAQAVKSSKYATAVAALSLSGCRSIEIEHGVLFEAVTDGLKITILGAKTHDGKYGSDIRSFVVAEQSMAFQQIHELCIKNGGSYTVRATAKAIGDCVSSLAKKVGLPKVSAYSFRHAMSADLKAGGFGADDIAKVMGHCTDQSQTYYAAGMGKGGGRQITNIEGREPVMKNKIALQALNHRNEVGYVLANF
jgi:integrase